MAWGVVKKFFGKVDPKDAEKAAQAAKQVAGLRQQISRLQKTIRSNKKKIEQHLEKIESFKKDPDAWDKEGRYQNCSPEIRAKRIAGRIRHWERELRAYAKNIKDAENAIAGLQAAIAALGTGLASVGASIVAPHTSEMRDLQAEGADVSSGEIAAAAALDAIGVVDPGVIDLIEWVTEK